LHYGSSEPWGSILKTFQRHFKYFLQANLFASFLFCGASLELAVASAKHRVFVVTKSISESRNEVQEQILRLETKCPHFSSKNDVFTDIEQSLIQGLGSESLGKSQSYNFKSLKSKQEFLKCFKACGASGLELDQGLKGQSLGDPLSRELWGINNSGIKQLVEVNYLTSEVVQGIEGEDVNLPRDLDESQLREVRIAVLDTGVDLRHPDLEGAFVRKESECALVNEYHACLADASTSAERSRCDEKFSAMDSDQNGYPLDCSGWNVESEKNFRKGVKGSPFVIDDQGHGSHVMGTIAARKNEVGIRGIALNAKLIPVRVLKSSPKEALSLMNSDDAARDTLSDGEDLPSHNESELPPAEVDPDVFARGMLYALIEKADIINMSLGWPPGADSPLMRKLIDLAHKQKRPPLIVAAAGNDSTDGLILPCSYSGVICVAAHGVDGGLTHFSNFGSGVEVAAPGQSILSTWPMSLRNRIYTDQPGWEFKSGTSMAAPAVASALAVLLGKGFSPYESVARLYAGVRPTKPFRWSQRDDQNRSVVFGNIDITASLRAKPRPIIVRANKTPKLTGFVARQNIKTSIELKNLWASAKDITLQIQIPQRYGDEFEVISPRESVLISQWDSLETIEKSIEIRPKSERVTGEFEVEVRVFAENIDETLYMPVNLVVPVDRVKGAAGIVNIPIVGPNQEDFSLDLTPRSVVSMDKGSTGEFFFVKKSEQNPSATDFLIVRRQESPRLVYQVQEAGQISNPVADLNMLVKGPFKDSINYVAVFRNRKTNDHIRGTTEFILLGSDLQPLEWSVGVTKLQHVNEKATLSIDFQWMKKDGLLLPTWVGIGVVPDVEKPGFDPWNLTPQDPRQLRLYYLSPKGLRSVDAPDDFTFIQALPSDRASDGVVRVVMAAGGGFDADFYIAEISEGQIDAMERLTVKPYHSFVNLQPQMTLDLNDDGGAQNRSIAFGGPAALSSLRVSLLDPVHHSGSSFRIDAFDKYDALRRLAGVYTSNTSQYVVAQSQYDLYFYDLLAGKSARTSLKRFSFLAGYLFDSFFYPVTLRDPDLKNAQAAVYIPGGFGVTPNSELLAVKKTEEGYAFTRPAKFRYLLPQGCTELDAQNRERRRQYTLMYFCGDRFFEAALTW